VRRRLPAWMILSLVVHVGVLAGGLMLVGIAAPPVLFVDLVRGLLADESVTTAQVERRDATPARLSPGASSARPSATSTRSARPAHVADAAPGHVPTPPPQPAAPSVPFHAVPSPPEAGGAMSSSAPSMPELVEAAPEPPRPAPSSAPPSTFHAAEPVAPPATGGGIAPSGSGPPTSSPNRPDDGAGLTAASGRDGSAGSGRPAAGGPPGLGAREGSTPALGLPGHGGADAAADALYAELRRRLEQALIYPPAARRRRLTGVVEVELEIEPSGAITRVALAASSSHRILDDAALDTVRGLDRVPFPPGIRPRTLRVRLPVEFAIR
jgi:periplasmic protein TonB